MQKVFGIGLTRTGTTSLAQAMQVLGYNSLHTPTNIQDFWTHDYTGDHFTTCRYKFLDHVFPDAKFIVTTRDIQSWLKSNQIYFNEVVDEDSNGNIRVDLAELRFNLYGSIVYDTSSFVRSFYKHMSDIMEHFKGRLDKVLFINICAGQGWGTLCPFLEKEIPDNNFPYMNILHQTKDGGWAAFHKLWDDDLLTSDKGAFKAIVSEVDNPDSNISPELRKKLKTKLEDM